MLSARLQLLLFSAICGPALAATSRQFDNLPLAFERRGLTPGGDYVGHGNAYTVDLNGVGARISFPGSATPIFLEFKGGKRPAADAGEELPGKANYILGRDSRQWELGLRTYRRVTYSNIYNKIDVAYYGTRQQLEFDLLLQAGADPRQIRLHFDGAQNLRLDQDGSLMVETPSGELRLLLPTVYQDTGEARHPVAGHYALLGNNEIGFHLERYDRKKALVIDPAIVYTSLIGGSSGAYGTAVAADTNGNTFLTGYTSASDFPTTNATQPYLGIANQFTGFVTKLDPTGTILYSTYLGGSGGDYLYGIAIDSTGAAWVTGLTYSTDFPVRAAYQATLKGNGNAVVAKLDASGALQYATYFGLSDGIAAQGIAVDSAGSAYVTGKVPSGSSVPTTSGAYLTLPQGGADAFAAKFSSSGTLLYSTYLGGTGDESGNGIAVDSVFDAYIAGATTSGSFPNAPGGGVQTTNQGGQDGFVAKLNSTGTGLAYFTLVGGAGVDSCTGIALDTNRNAYVTGSTSSGNFPVTTGVLQSTYGGGLEDGFVVKLNSTGSAFVYATFLGGNRLDFANAVAIDAAGDAFITGQTQSSNFPTSAPLQTGLPANQNPTSLFQTTNSGSLWSAFDRNIGGIVFDVLPDPGASGTIVALTDSGVYLTTDSGAAWTHTFTLSPSSPGSVVLPGSISRSLADHNTIYLLLNGSSYSSTDGGATWNSGGVVGSGFLPGTPILADPLAAGTAYVASSVTTLYRTVNGGTTWSALSTGVTSTFQQPPATFLAASDGSLYMDVNGSVYKGASPGTGWASISTGLSGSSIPNGLSLNPGNSSVLYRSGFGSFSKTTNGGTTWTSIASGLPSTPRAIAVSPASPSVVYAAASPAGLYLSTNGGSTWAAASGGLGLAAPTKVVFDSVNPSTAYAVSNPALPSAFVSKIDPTGSSLVYSTYLGGSTTAAGNGIATALGDVFVAGTSSGTLPGTNLFRNYPNEPEAFATRITPTATCSYTVSPLTQTVFSQAQSVIFTIVAPAGCAWTATSNQTWAEVVAGATGTGTGVVDVNVPSNTSGQAQTATLTIGGQQATLIQAPSTCTYSLGSSTVFQVDPAGGTVTANLTAGAGCPWSVVNNYPLALSIVSGASGTGSGTIKLNVGPVEPQQVRSLQVQIANSSIQINQTGPSCGVSTSFTVAQVQSIVNQALGKTAATGDLNADGTVNVADVQIAICAAQ